jgi:RNA polymerase II subunit A small phosphatase-like protein
LVHSSFRPIPNADFVLTVEVEGVLMNVYVIKRPWLDLFLQQVSRLFEVVVFTASLRRYADAVLDWIDPVGAVTWRLYRDSCLMHDGAYVKDLDRLGRPLNRTILVDNSAISFSFHPSNGLHSASFIEDRDDTGLLDIMAVLLRVRDAPDVRLALEASCAACGYSPNLQD